MCELLGADAEDVRSEEFRRVSRVLCQMIAVEPVAMMIEVSMKEDQPSWWTALTAENSVVSVARRKDVSELTVDDALNCAAQAAPWVYCYLTALNGIDPLLEASSMETIMGHIMGDEWWGPQFPRPSSLDQAAVNERLALLLMDVRQPPKPPARLRRVLLSEEVDGVLEECRKLDALVLDLAS